MSDVFTPEQVNALKRLANNEIRDDAAERAQEALTGVLLVLLDSIAQSLGNDALKHSEWRVSPLFKRIWFSMGITGTFKSEALEKAAQVAEFELMKIPGSTDPWISEAEAYLFINGSFRGSARVPQQSLEWYRGISGS